MCSLQILNWSLITDIDTAISRALCRMQNSHLPGIYKQHILMKLVRVVRKAEVKLDLWRIIRLCIETDLWYISMLVFLTCTGINIDHLLTVHGEKVVVSVLAIYRIFWASGGKNHWAKGQKLDLQIDSVIYGNIWQELVSFVLQQYSANKIVFMMLLKCLQVEHTLSENTLTANWFLRVNCFWKRVNSHFIQLKICLICLSANCASVFVINSVTCSSKIHFQHTKCLCRFPGCTCTVCLHKMSITLVWISEKVSVGSSLLKSAFPKLTQITFWTNWVEHTALMLTVSISI